MIGNYDIVVLVLIALLLRTVSANRADVQHSVAILYKGSALYRNIEVSDVPQAEVDEFLQFLLTELVLERLYWIIR